MNAELYSTLLAALRVQRAEIFSPHDRQFPISAIEDAAIPQIGFVGADYQPGGDILIGINPGGGGDKYVSTPKDALLLPMIAALRSERHSSDSLEAVFDQYAANMQTWNLWRIVQPVLDACQCDQTQITYLNWCPFRTRSDKMPNTDAMRRCRHTYLSPVIKKLAPGRIIALGKKAGKWLEREPFGSVPQFVVPRTIGDSYLSAEARAVLKAIRQTTTKVHSI